MPLRRLGLVGLVVLALTAGCGSFTDSGTDTTTVTPAPVPTVPSSPDDTRGTLAPGLSASEVTDTGTLARAHAAAANETSYRVQRSRTVVHRFGNTTAESTETRQLTYENASTYHLKADPYETVIDGQIRSLDDYEEYAGGDAVYRTWRTDEGRTVRENATVSEHPAEVDLTAVAIRRYLRLENETVSRIDVGEGIHYEIVGTRSTLPRFGRLDSFRARAVARADGFVRSLDVTFTVRRNDERIDIRDGFTYRTVGNVTVADPDWLSEAANGSTETDP